MGKNKNKHAAPPPASPPPDVEEAVDFTEEVLGARRNITIGSVVILAMGLTLAIGNLAEAITEALVGRGDLDANEDGTVTVLRHVTTRNGSVLRPGSQFTRREAGERVAYRMQSEGSLYTVKRPTENKAIAPAEVKTNATDDAAPTQPPAPVTDPPPAPTGEEGGQGEGGEGGEQTEEED